MSYVAVAADGRFIVYEAQVDGEFRLFMRRFDALESRQLAGTEGARGPFISPDGAWIGFVRNAKIYKVPTAGGDALAVCDVQGGPGAAWDRDGRIVFSRAWLSGLSIVSADGGTPTVLTTPDPEQAGDRPLVAVRPARRAGAVHDRHGRHRPQRCAHRAARSGHRDVPRAVPGRQGRMAAVRPHRVLPRRPLSRRAVRPVVGDRHRRILSRARGRAGARSGGRLVAAGRDHVDAARWRISPGPYVPPSRLTWIDADGTFTPLAFAPRPFIGVKLSPDGRLASRRRASRPDGS